MFVYALEVIIEDDFSENNWTKLREEDRFSNWYHGYTWIRSPDYYRDRLDIDISTSATSGVVTTQHYGEKFKPELVKRKLYYKVDVYPPESVLYNENVTLHFKVEKLSMKGLASSSKDTVRIGSIFDHTNLNADEKITIKKFTPPGSALGSSQSILLSRDVSSDDVETQKLKMMPGFIVRWWYSGMWITPDNKYKENDITKHFVR